MSYDTEAIYDEQINPLMAQIIALCKEHEIPHVASFYLADDLYCSSVNTELPHTPETFRKMVRILQPPRTPMMAITTRNGDGQIVNQTVVLGDA